jgi:polysaccharide export outer membrane protein
LKQRGSTLVIVLHPLYRTKVGVDMKLTILFVIVALSVVVPAMAQAPPPIDGKTRAYGESEFRLGPEDVIEVSVYQEKELSVTVPVRPDGKISIPLIGEMPASGKTATELQKEITQKYLKFIAEPAVTVVVKEVNSPKVSVLGEVKTPGVYKIKDRATILDVIALAGGMTEYAKKKKIQLMRQDANGEQRRYTINIADEIEGKSTEPTYVFPYDKIYVQ